MPSCPPRPSSVSKAKKFRQDVEQLERTIARLGSPAMEGLLGQVRRMRGAAEGLQATAERQMAQYANVRAAERTTGGR